MQQDKPKVIIYSSFGLFPMLEYELDIAQTKLDLGYEVIFVYNKMYDSIYKDYYEMNHFANTVKHLEIISKFKNGMKWLNKSKGKISLIDLGDIEKKYKKNIFNEIRKIDKQNVNDLYKIKKYIFRELNLYDSAFSGLSTLAKVESYHPPIDLLKKHLKRQLKVALKAKFFADYIIKEIKPKIIYIFNGRLPAYAPLVIECKNNNIPFKIYEYPIVFDTKYVVTENYIPHDILSLSDHLYDIYIKNSLQESFKIKKGEDYLKSRVERTNNEFSSSYADKQSIGNSVSKKHKKMLTIFSSTEAEMFLVKAIIDARFFNTQFSIFEKILNYLKDKDIDIVLRVHPNSIKDNAHRDEMLSFKKRYKNLVVLDSISTVDSYQLIKDSDYIFTCGSTITAESMFLMKQVFILGPSIFNKFFPEMHINSHDALEQILYKIANDKKLNIDLNSNYTKSSAWAFALLNLGVNPKYVKGLSYTNSILVRNNKETTIKPKKIFIILSILFEVPSRFSRGIRVFKENKKLRDNFLRSPLKIILKFIFAR